MLEAMLAALLFAALVAGGPALPPPAPTAVPAIPDEPGAFMLPEAPTYQAVAADLDGDGANEVVRLVRGERASTLAEVWREDVTGWALAGSAVEVVPGRPTGAQGAVTYAGTPARLIVRDADGRQRVTLVRQPRFEESDLQVDCCLLLDDLLLRDGSLGMTSVAGASDAVGAVSALDFDGDGTDELLVTRSLPPLGDISYPTEARVYRWNGSAFDPPTVTELPIGSGDSPFVLGDSDGLPGVEAAIIPSVGAGSLHRLSLVDGDVLLVEDSGLFATDAMAAPVDAGRGIAIVASSTEVRVHGWPPGHQPGPPASAFIEDAALLGAVVLRGEPRLLVGQPARHTLHLPGLPRLDPLSFTVTRSPAAAALESAMVQPFVGVLPGGGGDGEAAVVYGGHLVPSEATRDIGFLPVGIGPFATLAGAQPVGLVGRDRAWLAILHGLLGPGEPIDPAGGRLDPPVLLPGAGVSLTPLELAREWEWTDGTFEPSVSGASAIDRGGTLGVSDRGFTASVEAPPGSRVYLGGADPSVATAVRIVPESGSLDVGVVPPPEATGNGRMRLSLAVATPSGHAYLANWDARLLTGPPSLTASAATAFASSVVVEGQTAPYAEAVVDGHEVEVDATGAFRAEVDIPPWPTDVEVTATDPLGNRARLTLSAVGVFDYRTLPWVPISVVLVAVAAVVLFLRVPRTKAIPRVADDAVLEEMEPD